MEAAFHCNWNCMNVYASLFWYCLMLYVISAKYVHFLVMIGQIIWKVKYYNTYKATEKDLHHLPMLIQVTRNWENLVLYPY